MSFIQIQIYIKVLKSPIFYISLSLIDNIVFKTIKAMKVVYALLTSIVLGFGAKAEILETKTVDNGGSGMFKAIAVEDSEMPDFVIYRPQDLIQTHAREGELPVLMWANGGCVDTSIDYERFLTEVASHGYIVMAIGEMQNDINDRKIDHTESSELKRGLDWLLKQSKTKDSDFYNNIDTMKVAAAGHSCGGAQVLYNAGGPRIKTCLIMNAGMGDMEMAGASRESLPKLHVPVLYVTGGPDDVTYNNAGLDYDRINHVPVVWADHPASGHAGTYKEPNGGDYANLVIDWLDWQLKDKKENGAKFLDEESKYYDSWSIQSKNFVDFANITPLWLMNGDRQIYGELFKPQGEIKGTAIVCHGFNGNYRYGRNYFDVIGDLGYQCYVFDFPCGAVGSRSDSNTMNMSILDEQSDVRSIINYFKQKDPDGKIVLIGESQGGLVSALVAAQLGDVVDNLILVYPALCIPDNWRERYPNVEDIPQVTELWGVKMGKRFFEEIHDMKPMEFIGKYTNPVLIVQGDKDSVVLMSDSEKASQLYKDARLHVISGASHGFTPKEIKEQNEQIRDFLTEK